MPAEFLVRGRVSRALPQGDIDGARDGDVMRFSRYDEPSVIPMVRKQHALADEGTYFVTNNAQSAITGPAGSSFSHTAALLCLFNSDTVGNALAKRIYLDYLRIENGGTAMSAQTTATASFFAITIDGTNRYSSGATALTNSIVNPNSDSGNKSIANAYFGAVTASTQSSAVRTVVGNRVFRIPVSTTAYTLANFDTFHFNFGGVENQSSLVPGSSGTLSANVNSVFHNVPPIVIGPGQSMLLHLWVTVTGSVTAGTFFPELGWWER